jgi:polyferredoxin/formate hydrogenlyase subunit 6/NADH:ubiquinone oxidoreductase subunit I
MHVYGFLKWARRIIALAVFIGLTYFFIAFSAKATAVWSTLLGLQIVPGILGIATGGLVTVLVVMLMTLLFGRVYCSLLCPLGIYQDIVYRIGLFIRNKKKRRTHYSKPRNTLRYSILIVVVICVAFSFVLPLVWLDPYGLFGKMAANIGRPLAYFVSGSNYDAWNLTAFLVSAVILAALTVTAFFKGRLYCNTICPVGTLLGFVSRYSMFRVQIDPESCTHCRLCSMNCKSFCIDAEKPVIDNSRCVVCFNCISKCAKGSIRYRFAWKPEKKKSPASEEKQPSQGNSRRAFLIAAMGTGAGIVLLNRFTEKKKIDISKAMPPGAGTLERLKDTCIACHACIAACPAHIIKPAMGAFGWQGFLLPSVSYDNGFCGFDCRRCQEVCPSDALQLMPLEEKKRVKMGVVKLMLENCIVEKFGTDCGACDEHCPVKAVKMTPREGSDKLFPKTTPALCIGCGGCEFICPARPKAIVVLPLSEQRLADAPIIDATIDIKVEGFGF